MSTTVTYKGNTITTVNNQTRVLNTSGKWMEGDITLVDVTQGGTPSATAHTIHFEFDGNYSPVNITFYADSTFILDAIRATTPSTYDNKTVTLAQLDGTTWYSYTPPVPGDIPLNTQLIDFTKVLNGWLVDATWDDGVPYEYEWTSVSDFTEIDPSMTFTYTGISMFFLCFYDSSKAFISGFRISDDTGSGDEVSTGTLTPAKIPASAKYVRIDSVLNPDSTELSLIRTA